MKPWTNLLEQMIKTISSWISRWFGPEANAPVFPNSATVTNVEFHKEVFHREVSVTEFKWIIEYITSRLSQNYSLDTRYLSMTFSRMLDPASFEPKICCTASFEWEIMTDTDIAQLALEGLDRENFPQIFDAAFCQAVLELEINPSVVNQ